MRLKNCSGKLVHDLLQQEWPSGDEQSSHVLLKLLDTPLPVGTYSAQSVSFPVAQGLPCIAGSSEQDSVGRKRISDNTFDDILAQFTNVQPLSGGGQKVVYTINYAGGTAVLKVGRYRSSAGLERIQREVDVLRQISSSYFPRNFDFRVVDNSRYYIIEEYVNAQTLDKHFKAYSGPAESLTLVAAIADGLAELWSRRVVHRDIKPSNILVTAHGPTIIDLGIARLLEKASLTNSGAPFGPCTPDYASPEQLENRKREIDHRSDQFSLGIVWAQLLLQGQHPFDPWLVTRGASIPENILAGDWQREGARSCLKPKVAVVLERMLSRQPYQRFRRYQELQAILKACDD